MRRLMVQKTVRRTAACIMALLLVTGLIVPVCGTTLAKGSGVVLGECGGALESAYAEWQQSAGATGIMFTTKKQMHQIRLTGNWTTC